MCVSVLIGEHFPENNGDLDSSVYPTQRQQLSYISGEPQYVLVILVAFVVLPPLKPRKPLIRGLCLDCSNLPFM
jgi:hypothetical protein